MRCAIIVGAVLALILQASPASAELLNLPFPHYPRVKAIGMTVTFELPEDPLPTDTGTFRASGYTTEQYDYQIDDPDYPVYLDGDFLLEAVLNQDGSFVSGTLTVNADYFDPDNSMLFYSGTLADFGFGGADLFEFKFTQQGDMLAPDGEPVGVILSGVSIGFDPNTNPVVFTSGFANNDNGFCDVFYLPEPATAILLLAGLAVLRARGRP